MDLPAGSHRPLTKAVESGFVVVLMGAVRRFGGDSRLGLLAIWRGGYILRQISKSILKNQVPTVADCSVERSGRRPSGTPVSEMLWHPVVS